MPIPKMEHGSWDGSRIEIGEKLKDGRFSRRPAQNNVIQILHFAFTVLGGKSLALLIKSG